MTGPTNDHAVPPAQPALPPRRRTSMVRCYAAPWLALWTRAWPLQDGKPSLTLIAKATFDIVPGERVRVHRERPVPSGDVHAGGDVGASLLYPSDFAPYKARADVIFQGHAHAPEGGARESEVAVTFGRSSMGFRRRIVVTGARRWVRQGGKLRPGKPRRFDKVPLIYERAFGGAGHPANPVGVGAGPAVEGGALPQLEDPKQRLSAPGQQVVAVGLGAIPPTWRSTAASGSYDESWLATRWPYLPTDYDWAAFQAAPAAQLLDELRGDEMFSLKGMHPEHRELGGQLPCLRMRAFVQRGAAAGGRFEEVALRLDTVIVNADALTVTLLWRGATAAADALARDVLEAFALAEQLGEEPATLEQAEERFRAIKTPLPPVADEPETPAVANDTRAEQDADEGGREQSTGEQRMAEDDARERARAAVEAKEQQLEDQLKSFSPERVRKLLQRAGLPPAFLDLLEKQQQTPAVSGGLDTNAIEQLLVRVTDALPPGAVSELREQLAELRVEADAMINSAGDAPPDEATPSDSDATPETDGAPQADTTTPAGMRAEVVARLGRGESLEGLNLERADLSHLDLTDADLAGRSLAGARLQDVLLTRSNLRGSQLGGADLRGAQLGEADLRDTHLDRAQLGRADLSGAALEGASLREAAADGASFRGVTARHVAFDGMRAVRADFSDAQLDDARFVGAKLEHADFSDAQLERADFSGAAMAHVRLYAAAAGSAKFDDADLTAARADDAQLERASLLRVKAAAAVLEGARLERSRWQGAVMRGASLVRAEAEGASFAAVDLRGARLAEARLRKAVLRGADLMQAGLEHSDLRAADLTRASLHAADTWQANMAGARLDGAIVTQSKLGPPPGEGGRT